MVKDSVVLRNYQVIGVYHIIGCPRLVLGDSAGLGKTIEALVAYAYLKEVDPTLKLLVVASKSALYQWKEEVETFLTGVKAEVVRSGTVKDEFGSIVYGKPEVGENGKVTKKAKPLSGDESRAYQFDRAFSRNTDILVINYNTLVDEFEIDPVRKDKVVPKSGSFLPKLGKFFVVFDEATYFKSTKSLTFRAAAATSLMATRVLGMTATILKNRLDEAFAIYKVVCPGVFKNITEFNKSYAISFLMPITINGIKRKIPKITGYKNLPQFRATIDPYYLGRSKQEVAKELPKIISKTIRLEMEGKQEQAYLDALSGVLEVKSGKEITPLSALIYCQQISDSPEIIGVKAGSSKEDALFEMFDETLAGQKVIIYTNFKKLIDRMEIVFASKKIPMVRITGDETSEQRDKNKAIFQDASSGVDVIWINRAGSESINLQAASSFVFFDSPWSYGDYIQLIGRAQRIGSEQESIMVYHLVNKGTIDEHVLKTLKSKQDLVHSVFGDTATGELKFEERFVGELFAEMLKDATAKSVSG